MCDDDIALQLLHKKKIYGLLLHDVAPIYDDITLFSFFYNKNKKRGVEKVGISIYHPHELQFFFDNHINFDIIQLPYNILDRRFESYLSILKEKNIEIHVRSIYLQGLLLMSPKHLPPYFEPILPVIRQLNHYAEGKKINMQQLCMQLSLQY